MTEPRILALDSQILDAVQKCGFYTYLTFVKNWRNNETPMPLERGDLGHFLLENYYLLLKKGHPWEDTLEYCAEEARKHYQEYHSTDLETCEWTIRTFYQYAEFYRYDGIQIHTVEESFSNVLYESDDLIILYQGKIDLEASFPIIGFTAVDHKWRAVKANYTPLDNQLIGYAIHTNNDLVYINEVGLQKSYEPKVKFRRIPLNITQGIKDRWIKNTIQWAKILDHYLQNDVWPQSHNKSGRQGISQCEGCSMNSICYSENDEIMKQKIESQFHLRERWDVGKKLETEESNE